MKQNQIGLERIDENKPQTSKVRGNSDENNQTFRVKGGNSHRPKMRPAMSNISNLANIDDQSGLQIKIIENQNKVVQKNNPFDQM